VIVVGRDDARADLIRIIEHIRMENPIAARQVGREILLAGDSLAIFPRRGRAGRVPGTREYVARRPYIIVYEIMAEDRLDILNVWHGAQDKP
jgi:plasmid stabilization system protein ParE